METVGCTAPKWLRITRPILPEVKSDPTRSDPTTLTGLTGSVKLLLANGTNILVKVSP